MRILKRLSLKEVADRVGTSASALHRYESGWDRFELRTLRRLAATLDARLVVRLERIGDASPARRVTPGQLVARLRPLFWDVDLEARHLHENPDWVLRRVLRFGDRDAVHQARGNFGDEAVRRAAMHRAMDARTRGFWMVALGPEEGT